MPGTPLLLDLAPNEVYSSTFVTKCEVVSYTAFSPLHEKHAVCFLLHSLSLYAFAQSAWPLASIFSGGARTFLTQKCYHQHNCARLYPICLIYSFNLLRLLLHYRHHRHLLKVLLHLLRQK